MGSGQRPARMAIRLALADGPDSIPAHTEPVSDARVRFASHSADPTDRPDLMGRQLRLARPSLPRHVVLIVQHRPQPQMIRAYAPAIVTAVTDEHARWDRTDVELIGQAMRVSGPPRPARSERERPVSGGADHACPFPAFPGLIDVLPEPCRKIASSPDRPYRLGLPPRSPVVRVAQSLGSRSALTSIHAAEERHVTAQRY